MQTDGRILVVGGGIAGMTAAVEAAEIGFEVWLVEKGTFLGGRVARTNQYFPKLCPPYCGLEINFRRIKQNPRITVLTQTEVKKLTGTPGAYEATLKTLPRFVTERCTACDACVEPCPVERDNDFNFGLDKTKAVYLPHALAFPMRYVIDPETCLGTECAKCVEACAYEAIDLEQPAETKTIHVGAVVVATGWQPYDAQRLENLDVNQSPDIITNVMLERLAAPTGPTQGKVVRPSDGEEIRSVAFVQCAGSRDENHLPYCSGVCCLGSLKQATYIREQYPDAQIYFFYIDIRAPGRNEGFFTKVSEDQKLVLRKGKVAEITTGADGRLTVVAEDILSGVKARETVDLVVLATGMQPSSAAGKVPGNVNYDDYGFASDSDPAGIFGAGVARGPVDVSRSVQDATAATLKAIRTLVSGRAR